MRTIVLKVHKNAKENYYLEETFTFNRVATLPDFSKFLKPLFLSGNFL